MLIAYEVSLDIIRALRPVVAQLQKHSAEAAKQIEEAASSVVRNLAEGQRRRGRDPVRFYAMAHGSANEVRAQLDVADAWGWDVESAEARRRLDHLLALLWGLTHPRRRAGERTSSPAG